MQKLNTNSDKTILTLPEYDRIYRIIYSVIEGHVNTPHACMFFAVTGSLILNKHYKIPAQPVAGAFLLCVDETPNVIAIGKIGDGTITSDKDAFHIWVQTEHHVIDFMAPIFNESIKNTNRSNKEIPRKMFLRTMSQESKSIDSLSKAGDFFTLPDPELSRYFVETFTGRPFHMDLLAAADRWFKKYPKKLDDLSLKDDLGNIHKLELSAPEISGAW